MNPLVQQISLLARARYPFLQLVSHEEQRVGRLLRKVALDLQVELYEWRATTGLVGPGGEGAATGGQAEDALRALAEVDRPALFAFFDLHPFLWDARVVRRLRDLSSTLGARRQAIVLVGSSADTPPELEKDVHIIDVPLPGREEVGKLLAVLLRSLDLELPADRFERFVNGALGLTENEIKRLFARISLGEGRFCEDDVSELIAEKRRAIRRSRFLEFWESGGAMSDVGGMDNLKDWLAERRAGFTAEATAFGLPEPRGVFLLGVQGCGKSLVAKAVADLWRLPLLRLDVAAVFQSSRGEQEGLRETVRVAESLAPVVLWIDEIEKGFLSQDGAGSDAFGYFLTWMQEKGQPVFVVATANEVRILPPELLRKGRFDEIFFVDLPNVHERLGILEIHLRRRGRDPERFDLTQLAEETEKFSGAELEQVVVGGLFKAFAEDRELELVDLLDVGREMVPLAVTMDDHIKELREWARPRARMATIDRRRVDFFEEWEEA